MRASHDFDMSLSVPWADFGIPDEELSKALRSQENQEIDVRETFKEEFLSDSENDFFKIIELYRSSNKSDRSVIDAVFCHLCGYSLASLIKKTER